MYLRIELILWGIEFIRYVRMNAADLHIFKSLSSDLFL